MPPSSSIWVAPSSGNLPTITTGVFIGITVAVIGNVLISLALNLQKLAHKRLNAQKDLDARYDPKPPHHSSGINELPENESDAEDQPLQSRSQPEYGTLSDPATRQASSLIPSGIPKRTILQQGGRNHPGPLAIPVQIMPAAPENGSKVTQEQNSDDATDGSETEYLKSKLWWFGFLLMNVGEMGNFISYAWAPASVVAPLGTFALIANCFFAPLILKERSRKRDLFGILIAIIGAVTVVFSSNASDTRLDPEALVVAICQPPFLVYSCIYIFGAIILSILSEGRFGRQWVFVDVGLCALFGGFTVLSTKAFSTLLTMKWIDMFTHIITYPVILVLIITGVGQIRYLNRALMRFDSKTVIPVQFVLFNLSAIVGAAILYGDFRKATFHEVVTFLYGCGATFAGVFIIAWSSTDSNSHTNETGAGDESLNAASHEPRNPPQTSPTLGRKRRATLLLGDVSSSPILRSKQSAVSLMGLSSAQHLLLVHTPPRETPIHIEREHEGRSTRDSSIVGRPRHSVSNSARGNEGLTSRQHAI